jgi:hypothetical protein
VGLTRRSQPHAISVSSRQTRTTGLSKCVIAAGLSRLPDANCPVVDQTASAVRMTGKPIQITDALSHFINPPGEDSGDACAGTNGYLPGLILAGRRSPRRVISAANQLKLQGRSYLRKRSL